MVDFFLKFILTQVFLGSQILDELDHLPEFDILTIYRIEGIPHLMGDRGVDHLQGVVFLAKLFKPDCCGDVLNL